eukprot:TRINITY_DN2361_c1_g3_i2.p1 TRINITY_DN2361_c1_g3~~TRINITY_DN2361_c1_g3_i2.p1  ORF type:complete len:2603 (+),score=831.83 TRINITY_DN2361_c1_g3_i2:919-8727(+)
MMQCRQNNFVQRMWAAEKHTETFNCTLVPAMTCTPHALGCYAAPNSPELLLMGMEDGAMHVYGVDDDAGAADWRRQRSALWEPVYLHNVHNGAITTVRTLQDRECVITGGADSHIHVVHFERGTKLRTLRGVPDGSAGRFEPIPRHQRGVVALDYSPDLKMLVSVGMERHVLVWNPFVLKPLASLHGHTGRVLSAIFNTADNQIITLSLDRVVRVWDVRTYRVVQQEKDPPWTMSGQPGALYFDRKREAVVVGSNRLYVRPMNRAVDRTLVMDPRESRHRAEVVAVVYNDKFDQVLSADPSTVKVWDCVTRNLVMEFKVADGIVGLTFDHGGRRLVIACANGALQLWNYGNAQPLKHMLPRLGPGADGGSRTAVGLNDAGTVYATKTDAGHPVRLIIAAGCRSARFYKDDGVAEAPAWLAVPLDGIGGATAMAFAEPARLVFGTGNGELAVLHLGNIYAHPRCRSAIPLPAESGYRGHCALLHGELHPPVSDLVQEQDEQYQAAVEAAEGVPAAAAASIQRRPENLPYRRSSATEDQGAAGVANSLSTLARRVEALVWLRRTKDLAVAACGDGEIKIWNVRLLEQLAGWWGTFQRGIAVYALATDSRSQLLFSGDESGYIATYDISRLTEGARTCPPELVLKLHSFRATFECLTCIAWMEHRELLVVSSMKCTVHLYTPQGRRVARFGETCDPPAPLDGSPDRGVLVALPPTSAHVRMRRLMQMDFVLSVLEASPHRTLSLAELESMARDIGGDIFETDSPSAPPLEHALAAVMQQLSPEEQHLTPFRLVVKTPEGTYHYPDPEEVRESQRQQGRQTRKSVRLSSLVSVDSFAMRTRSSMRRRASGRAEDASPRMSVGSVVGRRMSVMDVRRLSDHLSASSLEDSTARPLPSSYTPMPSAEYTEPPGTTPAPRAGARSAGFTVPSGGAVVRQLSSGALPFLTDEARRTRGQRVAPLRGPRVAQDISRTPPSPTRDFPEPLAAQAEEPAALPPAAEGDAMPPRRRRKRQVRRVRRAEQPRAGDSAYLTELPEADAAEWSEDEEVEEEEEAEGEDDAAAGDLLRRRLEPLSENESAARAAGAAGEASARVTLFAARESTSRELLSNGAKRALARLLLRCSQAGCQLTEAARRGLYARQWGHTAARWHAEHSAAVAAMEQEWEAFRPCEIALLGVPPQEPLPRPRRARSAGPAHRSQRPRGRGGRAHSCGSHRLPPGERRGAGQLCAAGQDWEACQPGLLMQEDWQRWLEAPADTLERAEARASGAAGVARRFEHTASAVARRIVRELDLSERTVQLVPGKRWLYLHHGISYKLVTNPAAIRAHGSALKAMKAAAIELRAMQALAEVPHCALPLCCCVTFLGHRVFCACAITADPSAASLVGGAALEPCVRHPQYTELQPPVLLVRGATRARGRASIAAVRRPPGRGSQGAAQLAPTLSGLVPPPSVPIPQITVDAGDHEAPAIYADSAPSQHGAGSAAGAPAHHIVRLVRHPPAAAAVALRHLSQRLRINPCDVPVLPDGEVDSGPPPAPHLRHITSDQGTVRCAYSVGYRIRAMLSPWYGTMRTRRSHLDAPADMPPSPLANRAPAAQQSHGLKVACSVVGMELRRCGVSGRIYALHVGHLLTPPPPAVPGSAETLSKRLHPRFVWATQHPMSAVAFSPLVPSAARSVVDRQSMRAFKRVHATLAPDAAATLLADSDAAEPTWETVLHVLRNKGLSCRHLGFVAVEFEKLRRSGPAICVTTATEQVVKGRDRSQPPSVRLGRRGAGQLRDSPGIVRPDALPPAAAGKGGDATPLRADEQRAAAILRIIKEEMVARAFRDLVHARLLDAAGFGQAEVLVREMLDNLLASSGADAHELWHTELIPHVTEKYQKVPQRLRRDVDPQRLRARACALLGAQLDTARPDATPGSPFSPASCASFRSPRTGANACASFRTPRVPGGPRRQSLASPVGRGGGGNPVRELIPVAKTLLLPRRPLSEGAAPLAPGRPPSAPLPLADRVAQLEAEAEQARASCARCFQRWGPASPRLRLPLRWLGRVRLQLGDAAGGVQAATHFLTHCTQQLPWLLAEAHGELAALLRYTQPEQALPQLGAQLRIVESALGRGHWRPAHLLAQLARCCAAAGSARRALHLGGRALRRLRAAHNGAMWAGAASPSFPASVLSPRHRRPGALAQQREAPGAVGSARRHLIAEHLLFLAELLGPTDPRRAVALCDHALGLRQRDLGPTDPLVVAAQVTRARLAAAAAPETPQLDALRETMKAAESVLGPGSPEVAQLLDVMAAQHSQLGSHDTELRTLDKALALRVALHGPAHIECAATLRAQAAVRMKLGQWAAAQGSVEQALAAAEGAAGTYHPESVRCLLLLAGLQSKLGDARGALETQHRVLDVRERTLGPKHPETASAAFTCACMFKELGDDAAAALLFDRVCTVRLETLGYHHPQVGDAIKGRATCLAGMGQHKEALKLFREAFAVYEMCPGDPAVIAEKSHLLLSLGELQLEMGQFHEAIRTLLDAKTLDMRLLGADQEHPRIQLQMELHEKCERAIHKDREALDEKDHKRDNERKVRQWLQHTAESKICRPPRERPAIFNKMERVFILSDRIGEGLSTI